MTEKKLIPFLSLVFFLFFASYSFAAEVHFQWGTSSGVVEGYRIYYGFTHQGPYPNLLDQVGGTTTEYTATLDEGLTYYLVVRAFNDYGESGNSNEVVWPSGSVSVDSESPNTSGHISAKNATDISPDTNIVVHVTDEGDGVDQSSIIMKVNGETVQPLISGSSADYTLTYDPPMDFNYGQVVTVEIDAQDLHNPPNVMDHESYTFSIVNSGSGTYTNVSPTVNSFTCTPSGLNNPGETTAFNVSATDPDGDSLTYTINFGDGTANGSGSQVVHTYETQGTYTAEVSVDDGYGHTVVESLQVTVNDIPPTKPTNVTAN